MEGGFIVSRLRSSEHVFVSNPPYDLEGDGARSYLLNYVLYRDFAKCWKRERLIRACSEYDRSGFRGASFIYSRNVQTKIKLNFIGASGPVVPNVQNYTGLTTERNPVSYFNVFQQHIGSLREFYGLLVIIRASLRCDGTSSGVYCGLSHLGCLTPHTKGLAFQNVESTYGYDYIPTRKSDVNGSQERHYEFRFGQPPLVFSTALILLGLGFTSW